MKKKSLIIYLFLAYFLSFQSCKQDDIAKNQDLKLPRTISNNIASIVIDKNNLAIIKTDSGKTYRKQINSRDTIGDIWMSKLSLSKGSDANDSVKTIRVRLPIAIQEQLSTGQSNQGHEYVDGVYTFTIRKTSSGFVTVSVYPVVLLINDGQYQVRATVYDAYPGIGTVSWTAIFSYTLTANPSVKLNTRTRTYEIPF